MLRGSSLGKPFAATVLKAGDKERAIELLQHSYATAPRRPGLRNRGTGLLEWEEEHSAHLEFRHDGRT